MPDLLLRDVPQGIIDALERQAALHGRSAEVEHRSILKEALRPGFWQRAAVFGPRPAAVFCSIRPNLSVKIEMSGEHHSSCFPTGEIGV
jgi:plasmid stability protein